MTDVAGERPGLVREASECPVKDVGFDTEGFKRGEDRKRVTGQCGGEWMEAGRQEAETSEEVVELTGLEETLSETREMRSIPLSRFFLFSFQCFLGHYYTQLFYNLTVLICLFWKSLPTLFLGPEIRLYYCSVQVHKIFCPWMRVRGPRAHVPVNGSFTSWVGLNLKSFLYDLDN